MNDFIFYNPTKIIYGENKINDTSKYVKQYTKTNNILLVISESCKRNGILDTIINSLSTNNINYYIVDNIKPNPILDVVYLGKKICLENNIDFILAIGGASVIDTAKAISVAASNDEDIWTMICNPQKITKTLSLGTIITLYGSGSEMTNGAVISNPILQKKRGFDSEYMYPKFSIMDPNTIKSCPKDYLLIGMTDMFCHVLEDYFEITNDRNLSDEYEELLAKDMIKEFKQAKKDNQNNNKLMWMSTLAQNKFLSFGKKYNGEWVSHIIAHEFCMKYDFPHGRVVAILMLSWLNYIKKINKKRIINFGKNVFNPNIKTADECIDEIKKIFKLLNNPSSFKKMGVKLKDLDYIIENAMTGKKLGKYKELSKNDVKQIVLWSYYGI